MAPVEKRTGPLAGMKGQAILGYDAAEKRYTLYTMNSFGNAMLATGAVEGQVWTWNGQTRAGGELINVRVRLSEQSPTSNARTTEVSGPKGGSWVVIESGRATKIP